MKTSELEGTLLDYWVAMACDYAPFRQRDSAEGDRACIGRFHDVDGSIVTVPLWTFRPSTNWGYGGPIIEREMILLAPQESGMWRAVHCPSGNDGALVPCMHIDGEPVGFTQGPKFANEHKKPLVAAMRTFVASRFGETVSES